MLNRRESRIHPWLRVTAFVTAFCFTVTNVGLADGGSAPTSYTTSASNLSKDRVGQKTLASGMPESIWIPENLGRVKSSYRGTNGRWIIHIQDAHIQEEAQRSMAGIVKYLAREHGLRLVSLEGAEGNLHPEYLTMIPSRTVRTALADFLLRQGRLGGAEHFVISDRAPVRLFGVEDMKVYEANRQAYLNAAGRRSEAEAVLQSVIKMADGVSRFAFSPELFELVQRSSIFQTSGEDLAGYVRYLLDTASKMKLVLESYPEMQGLAKLLDLERGLDAERAEKQLGALPNEIKTYLPRERLSKFLAKSVQFQMKQTSRTDYYRFLRDELKALEGDRSEAQAFVKRNDQVLRYLDFLVLSEEIGPKLFQEIEELETKIKKSLFRDANEKRIDQGLRVLRALDRLIQFQMTPSDVEFLNSNRKEFSAEAIRSVWSEDLKHYHFAEGLPENLQVLDRAMERAESFYQFALQRDPILIKRAVAEAERHQEKVSAIVTGGFHTPGIERYLRQSGYSYLVVTPSITKPMDSKSENKIYENALARKPMPLEEVLTSTLWESRPARIADPRFQLSTGTIVPGTETSRALAGIFQGRQVENPQGVMKSTSGIRLAMALGLFLFFIEKGAGADAKAAILKDLGKVAQGEELEGIQAWLEKPILVSEKNTRSGSHVVYVKLPGSEIYAFAVTEPGSGSDFRSLAGLRSLSPSMRSELRIGGVDREFFAARMSPDKLTPQVLAGFGFESGSIKLGKSEEPVEMTAARSEVRQSAGRKARAVRRAAKPKGATPLLTGEDKRGVAPSDVPKPQTAVPAPSSAPAPQPAPDQSAAPPISAEPPVVGGPVQGALPASTPAPSTPAPAPVPSAAQGPTAFERFQSPLVWRIFTGVCVIALGIALGSYLMGLSLGSLTFLAIFKTALMVPILSFAFSETAKNLILYFLTPTLYRISKALKLSLPRPTPRSSKKHMMEYILAHDNAYGLSERLANQTREVLWGMVQEMDQANRALNPKMKQAEAAQKELQVHRKKIQTHYQLAAQQYQAKHPVSGKPGIGYRMSRKTSILIRGTGSWIAHRHVKIGGDILAMPWHLLASFFYGNFIPRFQWLYGTRRDLLSKVQIEAIADRVLADPATGYEGQKTSLSALRYIFVDNSVVIPGFARFAERRAYIGVLGSAGHLAVPGLLGDRAKDEIFKYLFGLSIFSFFTFGSFASALILVFLLYLPKAVMKMQDELSAARIQKGAAALSLSDATKIRLRTLLTQQNLYGHQSMHFLEQFEEFWAYVQGLEKEEQDAVRKFLKEELEPLIRWKRIGFIHEAEAARVLSLMSGNPKDARAPPYLGWARVPFIGTLASWWNAQGAGAALGKTLISPAFWAKTIFVGTLSMSLGLPLEIKGMLWLADMADEIVHYATGDIPLTAEESQIFESVQKAQTADAKIEAYQHAVVDPSKPLALADRHLMETLKDENLQSDLRGYEAGGSSADAAKLVEDKIRHSLSMHHYAFEFAGVVEIRALSLTEDVKHSVREYVNLMTSDPSEVTQSTAMPPSDLQAVQELQMNTLELRAVRETAHQLAEPARGEMFAGQPVSIRSYQPRPLTEAERAMRNMAVIPGPAEMFQRTQDLWNWATGREVPNPSRIDPRLKAVLDISNRDERMKRLAQFMDRSADEMIAKQANPLQKGLLETSARGIREDNAKLGDANPALQLSRWLQFYAAASALAQAPQSPPPPRTEPAAPVEPSAPSSPEIQPGRDTMTELNRKREKALQEESRYRKVLRDSEEAEAKYKAGLEQASRGFEEALIQNLGRELLSRAWFDAKESGGEAAREIILQRFTVNPAKVWADHLARAMKLPEGVSRLSDLSDDQLKTVLLEALPRAAASLGASETDAKNFSPAVLEYLEKTTRDTIERRYSAERGQEAPKPVVPEAGILVREPAEENGSLRYSDLVQMALREHILLTRPVQEKIQHYRNGLALGIDKDSVKVRLVGQIAMFGGDLTGRDAGISAGGPAGGIEIEFYIYDPASKTRKALHREALPEYQRLLNADETARVILGVTERIAAYQRAMREHEFHTRLQGEIANLRKVAEQQTRDNIESKALRDFEDRVERPFERLFQKSNEQLQDTERDLGWLTGIVDRELMISPEVAAMSPKALEQALRKELQAAMIPDPDKAMQSAQINLEEAKIDAKAEVGLLQAAWREKETRNKWIFRFRLLFGASGSFDFRSLLPGVVRGHKVPTRTWLLDQAGTLVEQVVEMNALEAARQNLEARQQAITAARINHETNRQLSQKALEKQVRGFENQGPGSRIPPALTDYLNATLGLEDVRLQESELARESVRLTSSVRESTDRNEKSFSSDTEARAYFEMVTDGRNPESGAPSESAGLAEDLARSVNYPEIRARIESEKKNAALVDFLIDHGPRKLTRELREAMGKEEDLIRDWRRTGEKKGRPFPKAELDAVGLEVNAALDRVLFELMPSVWATEIDQVRKVLEDGKEKGPDGQVKDLDATRMRMYEERLSMLLQKIKSHLEDARTQLAGEISRTQPGPDARSRERLQKSKELLARMEGWSNHLESLRGRIHLRDYRWEITGVEWQSFWHEGLRDLNHSLDSLRGGNPDIVSGDNVDYFAGLGPMIKLNLGQENRGALEALYSARELARLQAEKARKDFAFQALEQFNVLRHLNQRIQIFSDMIPKLEAEIRLLNRQMEILKGRMAGEIPIQEAKAKIQALKNFWLPIRETRPELARELDRLADRVQAGLLQDPGNGAFHSAMQEFRGRLEEWVREVEWGEMEDVSATLASGTMARALNQIEIYAGEASNLSRLAKISLLEGDIASAERQHLQAMEGLRSLEQARQIRDQQYRNLLFGPALRQASDDPQKLFVTPEKAASLGSWNSPEEAAAVLSGLPLKFRSDLEWQIQNQELDLAWSLVRASEDRRGVTHDFVASIYEGGFGFYDWQEIWDLGKSKNQKLNRAEAWGHLEIAEEAWHRGRNQLARAEQTLRLQSENAGDQLDQARKVFRSRERHLAGLAEKSSAAASTSTEHAERFQAAAEPGLETRTLNGREQTVAPGLKMAGASVSSAEQGVLYSAAGDVDLDTARDTLRIRELNKQAADLARARLPELSGDPPKPADNISFELTEKNLQAHLAAGFQHPTAGHLAEVSERLARIHRVYSRTPAAFGWVTVMGPSYELRDPVYPHYNPQTETWGPQRPAYAYVEPAWVTGPQFSIDWVEAVFTREGKIAAETAKRNQTIARWDESVYEAEVRKAAHEVYFQADVLRTTRYHRDRLREVQESVRSTGGMDPAADPQFRREAEHLDLLVQTAERALSAAKENFAQKANLPLGIRINIPDRPFQVRLSDGEEKEFDRMDQAAVLTQEEAAQDPRLAALASEVTITQQKVREAWRERIGSSRLTFFAGYKSDGQFAAEGRADVTLHLVDKARSLNLQLAKLERELAELRRDSGQADRQILFDRLSRHLAYLRARLDFGYQSDEASYLQQKSEEIEDAYRPNGRTQNRGVYLASVSEALKGGYDQARAHQRLRDTAADLAVILEPEEAASLTQAAQAEPRSYEEPEDVRSGWKEEDALRQKSRPLNSSSEDPGIFGISRRALTAMAAAALVGVSCEAAYYGNRIVDEVGTAETPEELGLRHQLLEHRESVEKARQAGKTVPGTPDLSMDARVLEKLPALRGAEQDLAKTGKIFGLRSVRPDAAVLRDSEKAGLEPVWSVPLLKQIFIRTGESADLSPAELRLRIALISRIHDDWIGGRMRDLEGLFRRVGREANDPLLIQYGKFLKTGLTADQITALTGEFAHAEDQKVDLEKMGLYDLYALMLVANIPPHSKEGMDRLNQMIVSGASEQDIQKQVDRLSEQVMQARSALGERAVKKHLLFTAAGITFVEAQRTHPSAPGVIPDALRPLISEYFQDLEAPGMFSGDVREIEDDDDYADWREAHPKAAQWRREHPGADLPETLTAEIRDEFFMKKMLDFHVYQNRAVSERFFFKFFRDYSVDQSLLLLLQSIGELMDREVSVYSNSQDQAVLTSLEFTFRAWSSLYHPDEQIRLANVRVFVSIVSRVVSDRAVLYDPLYGEMTDAVLERSSQAGMLHLLKGTASGNAAAGELLDAERNNLRTGHFMGEILSRAEAEMSRYLREQRGQGKNRPSDLTEEDTRQIYDRLADYYRKALELKRLIEEEVTIGGRQVSLYGRKLDLLDKKDQGLLSYWYRFMKDSGLDADGHGIEKMGILIRSARGIQTDLQDFMGDLDLSKPKDFGILMAHAGVILGVSGWDKALVEKEPTAVKEYEHWLSLTLPERIDLYRKMLRVAGGIKDDFNALFKTSEGRDLNFRDSRDEEGRLGADSGLLMGVVRSALFLSQNEAGLPDRTARAAEFGLDVARESSVLTSLGVAQLTPEKVEAITAEQITTLRIALKICDPVRDLVSSGGSRASRFSIYDSNHLGLLLANVGYVVGRSGFDADEMDLRGDWMRLPITERIQTVREQIQIAANANKVLGKDPFTPAEAGMLMSLARDIHAGDRDWLFFFNPDGTAKDESLVRVLFNEMLSSEGMSRLAQHFERTEPSGFGAKSAKMRDGDKIYTARDIAQRYAKTDRSVPALDFLRESLDRRELIFRSVQQVQVRRGTVVETPAITVRELGRWDEKLENLRARPEFQATPASEFIPYYMEWIQAALNARDDASQAIHFMIQIPESTELEWSHPRERERMDQFIQGTGGNPGLKDERKSFSDADNWIEDLILSGLVSGVDTAQVRKLILDREKAEVYLQAAYMLYHPDADGKPRKMDPFELAAYSRLVALNPNPAAALQDYANQLKNHGLAYAAMRGISIPENPYASMQADYVSELFDWLTKLGVKQASDGTPITKEWVEAEHFRHADPMVMGLVARGLEIQKVQPKMIEQGDRGLPQYIYRWIRDAAYVQAVNYQTHKQFLTYQKIEGKIRDARQQTRPEIGSGPESYLLRKQYETRDSKEGLFNSAYRPIGDVWYLGRRVNGDLLRLVRDFYALVFDRDLPLFMGLETAAPETILEKLGQGSVLDNPVWWYETTDHLRTEMQKQNATEAEIYEATSLLFVELRRVSEIFYHQTLADVQSYDDFMAKKAALKDSFNQFLSEYAQNYIEHRQEREERKEKAEKGYYGGRESEVKSAREVLKNNREASRKATADRFRGGLSYRDARLEVTGKLQERAITLAPNLGMRAELLLPSTALLMREWSALSLDYGMTIDEVLTVRGFLLPQVVKAYKEVYGTEPDFKDKDVRARFDSLSLEVYDRTLAAAPANAGDIKTELFQTELRLLSERLRKEKALEESYERLGVRFNTESEKWNELQRISSDSINKGVSEALFQEWINRAEFLNRISASRQPKAAYLAADSIMDLGIASSVKTEAMPQAEAEAVLQQLVGWIFADGAVHSPYAQLPDVEASSLQRPVNPSEYQRQAFLQSGLESIFGKRMPETDLQEALQKDPAVKQRILNALRARVNQISGTLGGLNAADLLMILDQLRSDYQSLIDEHERAKSDPEFSPYKHMAPSVVSPIALLADRDYRQTDGGKRLNLYEELMPGVSPAGVNEYVAGNRASVSMRQNAEFYNSLKPVAESGKSEIDQILKPRTFGFSRIFWAGAIIAFFYVVMIYLRGFSFLKAQGSPKAIRRSAQSATPSGSRQRSEVRTDPDAQSRTDQDSLIRRIARSNKIAMLTVALQQYIRTWFAAVGVLWILATLAPFSAAISPVFVGLYTVLTFFMFFNLAYLITSHLLSRKVPAFGTIFWGGLGMWIVKGVVQKIFGIALLPAIWAPLSAFIAAYWLPLLFIVIPAILLAILTSKPFDPMSGYQKIGVIDSFKEPTREDIKHLIKQIEKTGGDRTQMDDRAQGLLQEIDLMSVMPPHIKNHSNFKNVFGEKGDRIAAAATPWYAVNKDEEIDDAILGLAKTLAGNNFKQMCLVLQVNHPAFDVDRRPGDGSAPAVDGLEVEAFKAKVYARALPFIRAFGEERFQIHFGPNDRKPGINIIRFGRMTAFGETGEAGNELGSQSGDQNFEHEFEVAMDNPENLTQQVFDETFDRKLSDFYQNLFFYQHYNSEDIVVSFTAADIDHISRWVSDHLEKVQSSSGGAYPAGGPVRKFVITSPSNAAALRAREALKSERDRRIVIALPYGNRPFFTSLATASSASEPFSRNHRLVQHLLPEWNGQRWVPKVAFTISFDRGNQLAPGALRYYAHAFVERPDAAIIQGETGYESDETSIHKEGGMFAHNSGSATVRSNAMVAKYNRAFGKYAIRTDFMGWMGETSSAFPLGPYYTRLHLLSGDLAHLVHELAGRPRTKFRLPTGSPFSMINPRVQRQMGRDYWQAVGDYDKPEFTAMRSILIGRPDGKPLIIDDRENSPASEFEKQAGWERSNDGPNFLLSYLRTYAIHPIQRYFDSFSNWGLIANPMWLWSLIITMALSFVPALMGYYAIYSALKFTTIVLSIVVGSLLVGAWFTRISDTNGRWRYGIYKKWGRTQTPPALVDALIEFALYAVVIPWCLFLEFKSEGKWTAPFILNEIPKFAVQLIASTLIYLPRVTDGIFGPFRLVRDVWNFWRYRIVPPKPPPPVDLYTRDLYDSLHQPSIRRAFTMATGFIVVAAAKMIGLASPVFWIVASVVLVHWAYLYLGHRGGMFEHKDYVKRVKSVWIPQGKKGYILDGVSPQRRAAIQAIFASYEPIRRIGNNDKQFDDAYKSLSGSQQLSLSVRLWSELMLVRWENLRSFWTHQPIRALFDRTHNHVDRTVMSDRVKVLELLEMQNHMLFLFGFLALSFVAAFWAGLVTSSYFILVLPLAIPFFFAPFVAFTVGIIFHRPWKTKAIIGVTGVLSLVFFASAMTNPQFQVWMRDLAADMKLLPVVATFPYSDGAQGPVSVPLQVPTRLQIIQSFLVINLTLWGTISLFVAYYYLWVKTKVEEYGAAIQSKFRVAWNKLSPKLKGSGPISSVPPPVNPNPPTSGASRSELRLVAASQEVERIRGELSWKEIFGVLAERSSARDFEAKLAESMGQVLKAEVVAGGWSVPEQTEVGLPIYVWDQGLGFNQQIRFVQEFQRVQSAQKHGQRKVWIWIDPSDSNAAIDLARSVMQSGLAEESYHVFYDLTLSEMIASARDELGLYEDSVKDLFHVTGLDENLLRLATARAVADLLPGRVLVIGGDRALLGLSQGQELSVPDMNIARLVQEWAATELSGKSA